MKCNFYLTILYVAIIGINQISGQSSDPFARDLVKITEFYEGAFDNDSQLWFESRQDFTNRENEKHDRLHAIHTKINCPSIGDHVFYVEEFLNDDPEEIIRQRVISFKSDKEAGGIRMDLFFLKDADYYKMGYNSLARLDSIDREDVFELDGCHLIFKREADQFFGQMGYKDCQFGKEDNLRYSVHDIHLSENKYWRTDQTYLVANDELHSGNPAHEPHKMRKVNYYKCDISFTEKGYYDPSGKDKAYKDVLIHNQGGSASFYDPIKEKTYILQLREKEYPFYKEGSDFFMMRFIEEGAKRSEVIITSEPHINKISFSLGWSSAACYKQ